MTGQLPGPAWPLWGGLVWLGQTPRQEVACRAGCSQRGVRICVAGWLLWGGLVWLGQTPRQEVACRAGCSQRGVRICGAEFLAGSATGLRRGVLDARG